MCYSGKCLFENNWTGECAEYSDDYKIASGIADKYKITVCDIGTNISCTKTVDKAVKEFSAAKRGEKQ